MSDRAREYAEGDEAFAAWLGKVDAAVQRRVGLSAFDLSDFCFRDAFDDGEEPASVARAVIANDA